MSQYLKLDGSDADFMPEGPPLTAVLIIRASALIDGYCGRELGVKSYTERISLTDRQRGHLTYFPVVEVTAISGQARQGIMGNFFGPPDFEPFDNVQLMDVDKATGAVACGMSPFSIPYAQLEVTYTSGWERIPDKVKVACGMLASKLRARPDADVKAKKDFDLSIEYFGNSMMSGDVADLLDEYRLMIFR